MSATGITGRKIRVGIIGCGRVAEYHLRHATSRADAEVVGLVDAYVERAKRLGEKFGIAKSYASMDALLADQQVDVVHILTPPASHKELTLKAVDRGVHVLVEKPLTLTLEDAKEVLARAAAKGVIVVPDFIQMFHPRMMAATEIIESGRFGKVVSCECHFGLDLNIPELKEARGLHWSYLLPGGVLQNYITHPLYLVMRWTGAAKNIHVAHRSLGALPQGMTDQLDILIDGKNASGYITVSLSAQPSPYSVKILCERGTILVDFSSLSMLTASHGALPRSLARILPLQAWPMVRWTTKNVLDTLRKRLLPYHGLKGLFDGLYGAIANNTAPPVTPELAMAVSQAENDVFERAGKLHVDATNRPSRQSGVTKKERVLVTGAAGFVGKRVVARLVADGYYVRALARPLSQIDDLERLGVEIQFADLRDEAAVTAAAKGMDVILHVGAAIRGSADYQRESTVDGTRHIANAARANGAKRVIYISSMAVYDFKALRGPVTAESPLEARATERGVASAVKRDAEDIALEQLKSGTGWTILRPSLIFGSDRDALGMLGPRKGNMLICVGGPSSRLRLVHVDDVASAIVMTMQNPETIGRVFTLSHPDVLTYRQFFNTLPKRVTEGVRPVYLRRWFIGMAALGIRTLNRLRGRKGGMSPRQVQYLFADPLVDSTPIQKAGWRPAAPLRDQVAGRA